MPYLTQIPRNSDLTLRRLDINEVNDLWYSQINERVVDNEGVRTYSNEVVIPYVTYNSYYPDMDAFTIFNGYYLIRLNNVWYWMLRGFNGEHDLMTEFSYTTCVSMDLATRDIINGSPVYYPDTNENQRLYMDFSVITPSEDEVLNPEIYVRRHDYNCKSREPIVVGKWAENFKQIISNNLEELGF